MPSVEESWRSCQCDQSTWPANPTPPPQSVARSKDRAALAIAHRCHELLSAHASKSFMSPRRTSAVRGHPR
eukprot:6077236-Amphidinium_carterae.1